MINCNALIWHTDSSQENVQFELDREVNKHDVIRVDCKFYNVTRVISGYHYIHLTLEPITLNRIQTFLFYLCCFNSTFITH